LSDPARAVPIQGFAAALAVTGSPALQDLALGPIRERFSGNLLSRYHMMQAVVYDQRGDSGLARIYADSGRALLESEATIRSDDWLLHAQLATANAILGRRQEALREVARATELLPTSLDAVQGPVLARNCAAIEVRVGAFPEALDRLEAAWKAPSTMNSVGLLRVDRRFAPLRGNPRFERLLTQQPPTP
jgi:hypothetical protein